MLIAASVIALAAARLRIPYTVALVLGGLALGSFHLPILQGLFAHSPDWLTPGVSLVIFLPALLFEGSLKIQFRQLRESLVPICLLATVGVFAATMISLGPGSPRSRGACFWGDCCCYRPYLGALYFQRHVH
jgi:CPA1 family monovalent cation:H+ antiporter